ncbi:MAG: zf-HC2 domain-containing protein [Propionivibrio sp.]|jgi:predicted anti-sigma-YlaC factor YlaD|nr:zf-HC2 domain-containing protein [Propionivibrio sp.]MBP6711480.1 zf-HC2 domain-containing protein [Propionivibrio sp.]MBP7523592.1 zf-HC2 domain-containing protein [Propionivibrio sp.]MBP8162988.1 zf-HC2 domain-containing protein [Propionivibrio sp.]
MLKCRDVTHLLSEAQDRKLTLAERFQLEVHLAMCEGCKNFKGQMAFLREACKRYFGDRDGR